MNVTQSCPLSNLLLNLLAFTGSKLLSLYSCHGYYRNMFSTEVNTRNITDELHADNRFFFLPSN